MSEHIEQLKGTCVSWDFETDPEFLPRLRAEAEERFADVLAEVGR
jgi:hypothetical protein